MNFLRQNFASFFGQIATLRGFTTPWTRQGGGSVKKNLDPNGTYYIIVDSYSSSYAPNRLTEITRLDEPIYARDLLAEYIKQGGLSH